MLPVVLPQQWKGLQKTMTASFHLTDQEMVCYSQAAREDDREEQGEDDGGHGSSRCSQCLTQIYPLQSSAQINQASVIISTFTQGN